MRDSRHVLAAGLVVEDEAVEAVLPSFFPVG